MNTKNQNEHSVSVVIATLGGDSLKSTIESLNSGSLIPNEILICIPKQYSYRVEHLIYPNLIVVKTDCTGQVAQRAVGLRSVISNMTLQLDDDILFETDTLKILVEKLASLGIGNVLSPIFYNLKKDRCLHEHKIGLSGFVNNFWHFLFCGAQWGIKRMGTVTKVGLNYGVDDKYLKVNFIETEWLPGGCVLSFSEDLITHDFFPFTGKAFSEDLIHSYFRSQKGLRHWVTRCTKCFTEAVAPNSESDYEGINKARRYFLRLNGGSELRLNIFLIMSKIKGYITLLCKFCNFR